MTNPKTKYTVSEANRITGKSRTTIAKHLKAGKLAYEKDNEGVKRIDASELIRVYGDDCDFERADPASQSSTRSNQTQSIQPEQGGQTGLSTVQPLLDSERKERQREREQAQARIDHLEDALKRAQEGHNRATLLLEDRTSGIGDWEKAHRALEARIANQEETTSDLKAKALRYKRAYENEKNKSWWDKLFG